MAWNKGFMSITLDTVRETFRRDFLNDYFCAVEMLFRSNIMEFVDGQCPPSKVMIWDDNHKWYIGEMSFRTEVRAIRLRKDQILMVLDTKICVYNFVEFKQLNQYNTIANPEGLSAASHLVDNFILACSGLPKGQVKIEHYAKKRTEFINSHDFEIGSLASPMMALSLPLPALRALLLGSSTRQMALSYRGMEYYDRRATTAGAG